MHETMANKDIRDKHFGRLTALRKTPKKSGNLPKWLCICECGNTCEVSIGNLLGGTTKSCGCLRKDNCHNVGAHRQTLVEDTDLSHFNIVSPRNKSGVKGVCYNKRLHKWMAYIGFKNRQKYLGVFDSLDDAAEARRKAEQELYDPLLKKYGYPTTTELEESKVAYA